MSDTADRCVCKNLTVFCGKYWLHCHLAIKFCCTPIWQICIGKIFKEFKKYGVIFVFVAMFTAHPLGNHVLHKCLFCAALGLVRYKFATSVIHLFNASNFICTSIWQLFNGKTLKKMINLHFSSSSAMKPRVSRLSLVQISRPRFCSISMRYVVMPVNYTLDK